MHLISKEKGFTIMEVLVVVGITLILIGIVVGSFSYFQKNQVVKFGAERISSLIFEARHLTLSSANDNRYGVYFTSSSATLYQNSYSLGASTNKVVTLDFPASLTTINLTGGGSDLIFNRLTGDTLQYGTVTVSSLQDPSQSISISINQFGLIELH